MSCPENNTPCGCESNPCGCKTSSNDVSYQGPNLECTGINTCDTLTVAIQKLSDYACSVDMVENIISNITNNTALLAQFTTIVNQSVNCTTVFNCIPTTTTTTTNSSSTTTTTTTVIAPTTTTTTTNITPSTTTTSTTVITPSTTTSTTTESLTTTTTSSSTSTSTTSTTSTSSTTTTTTTFTCQCYTLTCDGVNDTTFQYIDCTTGLRTEILVFADPGTGQVCSRSLPIQIDGDPGTVTISVTNCCL